MSASDFSAGDLRAAPVRTPASRHLLKPRGTAATPTGAEMMTAAHIVPAGDRGVRQGRGMGGVGRGVVGRGMRGVRMGGMRGGSGTEWDE